MAKMRQQQKTETVYTSGLNSCSGPKVVVSRCYMQAQVFDRVPERQTLKLIRMPAIHLGMSGSGEEGQGGKDSCFSLSQLLLWAARVSLSQDV